MNGCGNMSFERRTAAEHAGEAGRRACRKSGLWLWCAKRVSAHGLCAAAWKSQGRQKGAEQIRAEEASEKTDGRAADIYATEKKREHISGPEILYGMGISGRRRLAYITVTGDEQLPGLEALLGYIGTFAGNEERM